MSEDAPDDLGLFDVADPMHLLATTTAEEDVEVENRVLRRLCRDLSPGPAKIVVVDQRSPYHVRPEESWLTFHRDEVDSLHLRLDGRSDAGAGPRQRTAGLDDLSMAATTNFCAHVLPGSPFATTLLLIS